MARKISCFIKKPGEKPYHTHISNSLEALQKNVGGYIEEVILAKDFTIICNEEGRINGMPYNCNICGVDFCGPIIFAGYAGEEFTDVPMKWELFKALFKNLFEEDTHETIKS